ncbi:zinc finger protein 277 isoform X2 [Venturia canescens]|uniref:zinc finger protein 277 isoform X2 n=1 Tax=Venturia canescens TaxID=32260 RepID=UPI001C9CC86A|nr:zinc finger protein 277 isoform X2 [Venturia canescens]
MTTEDKLENEQATHLKTQFVGLDGEAGETRCLLCDVKFILPTCEKQFLSHLFETHRLVIGDVWKIASLRSYVHYWGVKFREAPITTYCTTLLMDCTPDGKSSKNEVYYLLSDCISEDKTLRDELHRTRLDLVLSKQAFERTDTAFKRGCIFCRMEISGLRSDYLKHLSQKHNVQLGKPENLVFVDELFDRIHNSIESLTCIYCERIFKDRNVLKEHMRKKLHKRVNPSNKSYDKYYITNYLEQGSDWRQKQADETNDGSDNEEEDSSWGDWDGDNVSITCLICPNSDEDFTKILEHMRNDHNFDFSMFTKDMNFYEKVKVVNYVRRQIYEKKCIYCEEETENLTAHMREREHEKLPSSGVWNRPEFYFPMYETDSFLYNLDSTSDSEEEISGNLTKQIKEVL